MYTCSLLRTTTISEPAERSINSFRWHALLAILPAMAGFVTCRGLRDLLDAIPDSNDDFML
ncbi:hypothetical protein [Paraburkholderia sp.]|uniref:hypothetical protein n=1 Tax=Paraburkholderia sp. TaxID=1926495 RepID=UPI003D6DC4F6